MYLAKSTTHQHAKKVVSDSPGLVEMTCGLLNASFSLPEWQAVKMIFFAPCTYSCLLVIMFINIDVFG